MHHIIIPILLLFYYSGFSQLDLNQEVSPLSSVDLLELPRLDNVYLKSLHPFQKGQALRFAEGREVHVGPAHTGNWEYTMSDKAVWRQRIKSPDAHTLNVGFTKFHLPESGVLFIYNPKRTSVIGPLTKADNDDHNQYWTPMVDGDEIVIELQVDIERRDKVQLLLSKVNHDFLDIKKSLSGSCNLDVTCGDDDGWGIVDNYRDIISSVGAYTIDGIDACSGALINNTRRDCTPYFLTADHCGISNSNSASVVVYWNYQNSTCRQPDSPESGGLGDGLRDQFNSGSRLRASLNSRIGSDFTLLELDDEINPEYDLFFAGWDRTGIYQDTSICVHHPNVEEKRISFDYGAPSVQMRGSDSIYLRVENWEIGTTEGGSSGSPLFNTKKQIIGQLFGGFAACGNSSYDDYGALIYSWDNTTDPSRSLSSWLDPDNTGDLAITGMSCSYSLEVSTQYIELCTQSQDDLVIDLTPSENYNSLLSYSIENVPNGMDAELGFSSGDPDELNTLRLSNYESLTDSTYILNVTVTDGTNEVSRELRINIYQDVPDTPVPMFPANGEREVAINLTLITENQSSAQEFTFQLSTLPNFSDVTTESVNGTEWSVNDLTARAEYFWRVKAINPCGESDWSQTYTFFTSEVYCTRASGKDLPLTISLNPETVTSTIDLPYPVKVADVNVTKVQGLHEFIEDLDCRLVFSGEKATLFSNICFDNDNFDVGFDDESSTTVPCPPVDGMMHQPVSPLSVFNGMTLGGAWNMEVEDTQFIDGGEFQSWSMEVCYSGAKAPIIIPSDHDAIICNSGTSIYSHYLPGDNNSLRVTDSRGNDLDFSLETDSARPDFANVIIEEELDRRDGPLTLSLIDDDNDIQFLTQVYLILSDLPALMSPIITEPSDDTVIKDDSFQVSWTQAENIGNNQIQLIQGGNVAYEYDITGQESTSLDTEGIEDGDYRLRVGVYDGCNYYYSDEIDITIDLISSSTELQEIENITIRPNPNNGTFHIDNLSSDYHNARLHVYNMKGELVHQEILDGTSVSRELDITHLDSGVYYLNITSETYNAKAKVVKID